jgi:aminoglycoside phosphotransferase family enzyme/predicted kinase
MRRWSAPRRQNSRSQSLATWRVRSNGCQAKKRTNRPNNFQTRVLKMGSSPEVPTSSDVVALLSRTSSYPDAPSSVETVETHISWVFLTDRFAYKLKKPVCFEFVDFSTLESRHRACLEEVRLNRRLAGDVYLGVLPITRDRQGSLSIDGPGQPLDWITKMRRLPADKALDDVLSRGQLTSEVARDLAHCIADFYAHLPAAVISSADFRQALQRHIKANRDFLTSKLLEPDRLRVRRAIGAQLQYLGIETDVFDERIVAGRIVEGHGDLRPDHIYLEEPPVIIDCIEFSRELRTVDVADDLSFLALECQRMDRGDLGDRVTSTYQRLSGDQFPASLLAFYKSYRACVRAKVCLIRAEQEPGNRRQATFHLIHQYADLAHRYAAELGGSVMLIVCGLMGSGKSTLARAIAETIGAELLSTDQIRQAMFGASQSPAAYGEGNYQWDSRRRVYDEVFRQVQGMLDKRLSVVLDGTFPARSLRTQAMQLAARHGAASACIYCQCPRDTALSRIEQRAKEGRDASEARSELYDAQAREFEPVEAAEPARLVDSTASLSDQLQFVASEVRRRSGEVQRSAN